MNELLAPTTRRPRRIASLRRRRLRLVLPPSFVGGVAASLLGAALLSLPARHLRVDVVARHRAAEKAAWAALYALALALLVAGWRAVVRRPPSLRAVMWSGLALHLCALLAPPFLSLDCLCYAAIGRAMHRFGASGYAPLGASLPPGDPFLALLPDGWRLAGSAYSAGFNQLARLVSVVTGDDVSAAARAFQLVAAGAMLLAAWLTARAVGERRPEARASAAALVLFCPLAVIEATVNAHNDALLAVAVALWTLAVAGAARRGAGFAALLAAVAVKASALLLVLVEVAAVVVARLGARRRARTLALGFAAFAALALALLLAAPRYLPSLRLALALVGSTDAAPHCTRSIECIPRALLFWTLHLPRVAWLVGLAFRVAGAAWLAYSGFRAARDGRSHLVATAATALLVYYLFLHGFMQSWYLLSLLPLLPFAAPRVRHAGEIFLVSSLAYYVLFVPLSGDGRVWVVALKELSEGVLAIVPPALALLRRRSPPASLALSHAA